MILKNVTALINGKLRRVDVSFSKYIERVGVNLGKGVNCKGLFLMPGLRNAHVHLASRLVSGSAVGLGKYEYFDNIGFKVHDKRTSTDVYNASLLACAESLLNGVTHVDTMDMNPEVVVKAITKLGLDYTVSLAVKDYHTEAGFVEEQFNRTLNIKGNALLGLANEFECSPQLIREGLAFARENDLPIHMHVCETSREVNYFKKLTGYRTIDYLDRIGFLDHDVRLAHCTYADSKDILLLANHDVPVLHCPTSNKAISGIVPKINLMLENKVKVWLGTDSFAWNPNPSVLSEALNAVRYDNITPLQAYYMTHEPFGEGSKASFSLVNIEESFLTINEFLIKLMSKPVINQVFLNGEEVVNKGVIKNLNLKKLVKKVNNAKKRITH